MLSTWGRIDLSRSNRRVVKVLQPPHDTPRQSLPNGPPPSRFQVINPSPDQGPPPTAEVSYLQRPLSYLSDLSLSPPPPPSHVVLARPTAANETSPAAHETSPAATETNSPSAASTFPPTLQLHRLILPPDLRPKPLPHSSTSQRQLQPSDPASPDPPLCGYTALYCNVLSHSHRRQPFLARGSEGNIETATSTSPPTRSCDAAVRTSSLAVLRVVTCGRATTPGCSRCRCELCVNTAQKAGHLGIVCHETPSVMKSPRLLSGDTMEHWPSKCGGGLPTTSSVPFRSIHHAGSLF